MTELREQIDIIATNNTAIQLDWSDPRDNCQAIAKAVREIRDALPEIKAGLELLAMIPEWQDCPTKGGYYWLSPFVEGGYRGPWLKRVIDFDDMPRRGLELEEGDHCIPITRAVSEYYPKGKWLYIACPRPYEGGK